jgi:lysophospholipase L1-like esterase
MPPPIKDNFMSNRINFLPPWVETNLQPAFYDLESGTSLQQTARMYAKVNQLIRSVNEQNETIADYIQQFVDLRNYVEDYFDNLDVQEEINNKLDAMVQDGTIKSILNNELLGEINNKVLQNTIDIEANSEAIENKVSENQADSISMSMLKQEVREAMTGGSTAVVGTDSVGTVNLKDGAVTFYKMDKYLQDTKLMSYGSLVNLGSKSAGIARENTSTHKVEVVSPTSTDYSWYKVALTKDKYYTFSVAVFGPCGFILADSDDNVVYNSVTQPTDYHAKPVAGVVRVNETGMNAYICIAESTYKDTYLSVLRVNTPNLRCLDHLYNTQVTIETPNLVRTVEGSYLSYTHVTGSDDTLAVCQNYEGVDTLYYEMCNGVTYHISSYDWAGVVGLYILNMDNTIIYQSSDQSHPGQYVPVDYTFTATKAGYIVVPKYASRTPVVEIVSESTSGGSSELLTFDKWFALGDSLTEVNFRAGRNYVDYITEELGITSVNLGHSGAGYMKNNTHNQNFRTEVNEISGYNYNTDIITIMGSINDFSYISTALGQLGDTGTDTIYGCMYNFFNDLQSEYMGVRLGVITLPSTTSNRTTFYANATAYNTALKETAKLFSVPVLDLTESCNLKPWEATFRNEFYSADGIGGTGQVDDVHPNSKGHWLIHNKIKEFLKTL